MGHKVLSACRVLNRQAVVRTGRNRRSRNRGKPHFNPDNWYVDRAKRTKRLYRVRPIPREFRGIRSAICCRQYVTRQLFSPRDHSLILPRVSSIPKSRTAYVNDVTRGIINYDRLTGTRVNVTRRTIFRPDIVWCRQLFPFCDSFLDLALCPPTPGHLTRDLLAKVLRRPCGPRCARRRVRSCRRVCGACPRPACCTCSCRARRGPNGWPDAEAAHGKRGKKGIARIPAQDLPRAA